MAERRLAARKPAAKAMGWTGQNGSIFLADIAGYAAPRRREGDRRIIKNVMYDLLGDAFGGSGVSWDECHAEDRGDGALVIAPPELPTSALIDPLLAVLAEGLRRHNERSDDARRIPLRVALDVGPVVSDRHGVTGDAIIHAARLLDSPVLKRELARSGAHLGVMVSSFVHRTVIEQGPGHVVPNEWECVRFRVKESSITAWMHLYGVAPAA